MKNIVVILGLTYLSISGFSQENLVGKKAPRIDVNKWVYPKIQVADWQNKPVSKDLRGKVIVLDFWFTKCAPCVASIPELNHLAEK
jgi:thiol-disulfide isomerase/thioredoxin